MKEMKLLNKNIIFLILAGIFFTIPCFANYEDQESISASLTAQTLAFSVQPSPGFIPDLVPGNETSKVVTLQNEGSISDVKYSLSLNDITGDLCGNVEIKDDINNSYTSISSYLSPIINLADRQSVTFIARLNSDDESLENKTCSFDIVVKGWQAELESDQGFSDEKIINSEIKTGKWIAKFGEVVINELMWMGTWGTWTNSNDKWLELRNMTSSSIDLSNWQITKLEGSGGGKYETLMMTLPQGSIIPADGFFLISKFSKEASSINVDPDIVNSDLKLRAKDLQIKLYRGDWNDSTKLIDVADDGSGDPLAGYHGIVLHLSMERNDIPGDGTLSSSWHTCLEPIETRIYWDSGFLTLSNWGTPGDRNLSEEEFVPDQDYFMNLELEFLLNHPEYYPDYQTDEDGYGPEIVAMPTAILPPVIMESQTDIPSEEDLVPEEETISQEGGIVIEETPILQEETIIIENDNQVEGDDNNSDSNSDGGENNNSNEENEQETN